LFQLPFPPGPSAFIKKWYLGSWHRIRRIRHTAPPVLLSRPSEVPPVSGRDHLENLPLQGSAWSRVAGSFRQANQLASCQTFWVRISGWASAVLFRITPSPAATHRRDRWMISGRQNNRGAADTVPEARPQHRTTIAREGAARSGPRFGPLRFLLPTGYENRGRSYSLTESNVDVWRYTRGLCHVARHWFVDHKVVVYWVAASIGSGPLPSYVTGLAPASPGHPFPTDVQWNMEYGMDQAAPYCGAVTKCVFVCLSSLISIVICPPPP
jgi:hypothetical protein